jgi:hypothetical protein
VTNLTHARSGVAIVFSLHPHKIPRHGGQLRLEALLRQYRKTFATVVPVAIFHSDVYPVRARSRYDIPAPAYTRAKILEDPNLEAWALGKSPREDAVVNAAVRRILEKFHPTVLIFEQPYLFEAISEIVADMGLEIPVIFSSQNIEATMMTGILNPDLKNSVKIPMKYETELAWLAEQETALANRAVGTIAVSDADAAEIRGMGSKNVVIAANGIDRNGSSRRRRTRLKRIMAEDDSKSYAFFIGSAHRPNAVGLVDVLGTRLGYIPKYSKIYIAGLVGQIVRQEIFKTDPYFGQFYWTRAREWGIVTRPTLQTLIEGSHCIILPIISGGGSNLKTAEAILSGRPIVATSIAFRGFESLKTLSNVTICDNPEEFRAAMIARLKGPWVTAPIDEASLRESVTWQATLAPLDVWLDTVLP